MEAIAPALLMALASGTAGAAGEQIWAALRNLVRRPSRAGESRGEGELTALAEASGSAERAADLAEALVARAEHDPAFAQALAAWQRKAEACGGLRTGAGDSTNTVIGGNQGTVVQVRDIHGSVNTGGRADRP